MHGSTFKVPLEQFAVERTSLHPLPASLPEISVWQKVALYRDCHVRYQYCSYSAPCDKYNEPLWLKATPTMISIYHNHICIAQHARLFKKGERSTVTDHLPTEARYYFERNSEWCLKKSAEIGESCFGLIDQCLHHPTRDLLRQAQGILGLEKRYGRQSLEQACGHARLQNTMDYHSIKSILEQQRDNVMEASRVCDATTREVYSGGARFQRQAEEFKN